MGLPSSVPLPPGSLSLRGVEKTYHDRLARPATLKESLLAAFSPSHGEPTVHALRGIDLEIASGESIGIVGANGSGKSTLLKLIAGITEPTRGSIEIEGRVHGMIELGSGFHPDLSGKENVRLQGAIYGLSRGEVDAFMERILEFAQLVDFRDAPLKHYSSGMIIRLGFAIAIHCNPDILLVDEVLAVGDRNFQARCLAAMERLRAEGKTIILVTHQMDLAERTCSRLLWLKDGAIHQQGPALEVLQAYQEEALRDVLARSEGPLNLQRIRIDQPGRFGTGEARIEAVRTVDSAGIPRRSFREGEPLLLEVEYTCQSQVESVDCSIAVTHESGENVAFWRAEAEGGLQRPQGGRGCFRLRLPHPLFSPARYTFTPAISPPGGAGNHYDIHLRVHGFVVAGDASAAAAIPVNIEPAVTRSETTNDTTAR